MNEVSQGKLVRQTKIEVTPGQPSPAEARRWLKQQIVYRNFAGMHADLDESVKRYVTKLHQDFQQQMSTQFEHWETIWDSINGNPSWGEYEDDIHVPETQKKFRQKTARIYEALNDFDPIFECEGTRGDLPERDAVILGSYVYRNMEMAKYRDLVQPVAGDMEACNRAAIKIQWEVKTGTVVEREWERFEEGGKLYERDERRMRDATTVGLKYRQVDPFRFVYDIGCPDLNSDECAFVGDESDQFLHDLEAMAKNGLFSKEQVAKIKNVQKGSGGSTSTAETANVDGAVAQVSNYDDGRMADMRRSARNVAQATYFGTDQMGANMPRKVRCLEIWGWYDFGAGFDGVCDPLGRRLEGPHKVVITTGNGIPIQIRLNPLDKKFHPYATEAINRTGHEAVAPSNFEQVIQVNAQYDGYASNVLRNAHLSVAPIGTVQGEAPVTSLLHAKPGTLFSNVNKIEVVQMGDMGADVSYMDGKFRREIEETSGVLNVFESPQGTATETNRKVQEQQRAIRHSVIANGNLWKQVAQKSLWLLAQFSTGAQRFKVAGKASMQIGRYFEITPDLMQEDVEFRMLGVDNLHVFGDRSAGLTQWMNEWGPLLPGNPNINMLGLMRRSFELKVGRDRIQEIFPSEEPVWATWPQDQENHALMRGEHVPISSQDDDETHMKKMVPHMKRLKDYPVYVRKAFLTHFAAHAESHEKKAAEEKAAMQQSMQEQALMGGRPGVDKAPTPGGMEAQSKSGAQTPGTTPGPTQARTVAKTGRQGSGISQSQRSGAA